MPAFTREVLIVRDVLAIPARPPVPIGLFPVAGVGPGIPNLGQPGQTGQLAAGSVWLFAPPLAQHSPPNNYCGFHIKDGKATLQGQATVGPDGVVHIRANDVLTVAMDIDAPAAPELKYPASVTFDFRPDGAHITALSAFGLTTYGTALALTRNAAAPFYEPTSQCVLIPADTAPASLTFANVNSTLFIPSGAAPITGAAWALHTSTKTVGQLGDAAGAGAVALQLAGISARWSGLAASVSFGSGLLLAEPGQLTFTLQYNGPSFTETCNLWQESATNRLSSIDLICTAGMNVRYFSGPGAETLQVNACLASAFLDRPVQVDGGRLAVTKWPAFFVLSEIAGVVNIGIQAQPSPGMQGSIILALENSLLGLGVPASLGVLGVLDATGLKSGRLQLDFPFRTILLTLPDPYMTPLTTPMIPGENLTASAVITWANPATPSLAFSSSTFSPAPPPTQFNPLRALVDVSSNADQLGVLLFSDFTAAPQFQTPGHGLERPGKRSGADDATGDLVGADVLGRLGRLAAWDHRQRLGRRHLGFAAARTTRDWCRRRQRCC